MREKSILLFFIIKNIMRNIICCFTDTGNNLNTAGIIADETGGAEPIGLRPGLLIKVLICLTAILQLCSFRLVRAATPADDAFKAFMDDASGRYFIGEEEGFTVLELIPAFGKLFASSAHYTKEASLYAYSASELLPLTGLPTSFDFRMFPRFQPDSMFPAEVPSSYLFPSLLLLLRSYLREEQ